MVYHMKHNVLYFLCAVKKIYNFEFHTFIFWFVWFLFRNVFSYEDIRSKVVDFLDSLVEFLETEDFKTYILPDEFTISTAKETLTARRKDLLRDSVVVIAGDMISFKLLYTFTLLFYRIIEVVCDAIILSLVSTKIEILIYVR